MPDNRSERSCRSVYDRFTRRRRAVSTLTVMMMLITSNFVIAISIDCRAKRAHARRMLASYTLSLSLSLSLSVIPRDSPSTSDLGNQISDERTKKLERRETRFRIRKARTARNLDTQVEVQATCSFPCSYRITIFGAITACLRCNCADN
jgi:hypothetical protein